MNSGDIESTQTILTDNIAGEVVQNVTTQLANRFAELPEPVPWIRTEAYEHQTVDFSACHTLQSQFDVLTTCKLFCLHCYIPMHRRQRMFDLYKEFWGDLCCLDVPLLRKYSLAESERHDEMLRDDPDAQHGQYVSKDYCESMTIVFPRHTKKNTEREIVALLYREVKIAWVDYCIRYGGTIPPGKPNSPSALLFFNCGAPMPVSDHTLVDSFLCLMVRFANLDRHVSVVPTWDRADEGDDNHLRLRGYYYGKYATGGAGIAAGGAVAMSMSMGTMISIMSKPVLGMPLAMTAGIASSFLRQIVLKGAQHGYKAATGHRDREEDTRRIIASATATGRNPFETSDIARDLPWEHEVIDIHPITTQHAGYISSSLKRRAELYVSPDYAKANDWSHESVGRGIANVLAAFSKSTSLEDFTTNLEKVRNEVCLEIGHKLEVDTSTNLADQNRRREAVERAARSRLNAKLGSVKK